MRKRQHCVEDSSRERNELNLRKIEMFEANTGRILFYCVYSTLNQKRSRLVLMLILLLTFTFVWKVIKCIELHHTTTTAEGANLKGSDESFHLFHILHDAWVVPEVNFNFLKHFLISLANFNVTHNCS